MLPIHLLTAEVVRSTERLRDTTEGSDGAMLEPARWDEFYRIEVLCQRPPIRATGAP